MRQLNPLLFTFWVLAAATSPAAAEGRVWSIEWDGAIGPATVDYIARNLDQAAAERAELFVIRLDTPGGLVESTRRLNQKVLASPVPVAMWVGPSGARAASAGTYMMYASHIAAMAPATHIGASTPVSMEPQSPRRPGLPFPMEQPAEDPATSERSEPTVTPPGEPSEPDDGGAEGTLSRSGNDPRAPAPETAMERKAVNDMVAYLQGLAELRGRNAQWAEATVRDAASLTAEQALEINVIDYIAASMDDLLEQLDGTTVTLESGDQSLATADAEIHNVESDWRNEFLKFITNPTFAYQLLAFGGLLLLIEFYNPGIGLPGVVGLICLVTGMYGMQMLPVNYAGLVLIVVGLGLVLMEVYTPTFGLFGTGGMVAFVLGSIMLMDSELEAFQISVAAIATVTGLMLSLTALIAWMAIRSHRRQTVSGEETLVGSPALALEDFTDDRHGYAGRVFAQGESWNAISAAPISRDAELTITRIDGLTLTVAAEEN